MSVITKVYGRQIFDSRGNPTVEVEVTTEGGVFRAAVPSGASTGIHEALEMRDGGDRYMGKGVMQAVGHVNEDIAPLLVGMSVEDPRAVDDVMNKADGTHNKSTFGANAILGVSMAVYRASAHYHNKPLYRFIAEQAGTKQMRLPVPCMNVINGGKHAGNSLAPQEYMICPVGAKSFHEAMIIGTEVYHTLKKILKARYGQISSLLGDEGGYAPALNNAREPLELLVEAIEAAGYTGKVKIAMDVAAAEFYENGQYDLGFKMKEHNYLSGEALAETYQDWVKDFPIVSIEDPFDQDDFASYGVLTSAVKETTQIVGDDLTVSNVKRIEMALENNACNALLLKVNQIGTVSEAIDAAKLAMENDWAVMVSHRSGETEDCFIADLCVGLGTGQCKFGAPARSERVAKFNQLLRIEEELEEPVYGFPKW
eukprot:TRINITY_DN3065_c1_g1_i4.p1 TRINITY_DN3065_c1_g1~~TRINITY_DN3065_c1_g1_i4.p1  ORF type:complete len:426 (-),score=142.69 TRINITY_DN3065_c1_g1_i4:2125-3402(-)